MNTRKFRKAVYREGLNDYLFPFRVSKASVRASTGDKWMEDCLR